VKNLIDQIFICEPLLKQNEIESFLKRFITSDEKWITYDNNSKDSGNKANVGKGRQENNASCVMERNRSLRVAAT